jgi:hypothetical protein
MRNLIAFVVAISVFAASGCGSNDGGKVKVHTVEAVSPGHIQVSTCGARRGFEFKLHKVDCEIANALIVMLDGHALHQSVILTAEGKQRGAWVCTSPTHSLVDRLHCSQGNRFLAVERASR